MDLIVNRFFYNISVMSYTQYHSSDSFSVFRGSVHMHVEWEI